MKKILLVFALFQFLVVPIFAQQYKYHIVEKGETIYSIAQKYNVSVETIYTLNPDARKGISPDNKIVVPLQSSNVQPKSDSDMKFTAHRVKRQETLFSLSQQYNVDIEDIKRYNPQLYSKELQRGDKIKIPVNLSKIAQRQKDFVKDETPVNPMDLTPLEHVVLPKETKFGIAQKYNLSVEDLNRLNPGVEILKPGMVLKISSKKKQENTNLEDKLFRYYLVKPQETLYTLTDRFRISRDSLIVLNPALKAGLKAGMVLKIPNNEVSLTYGNFSEENFIDLRSRITNYSTKNLVVMLPFHLDKITTSDSTSNMKERIKKDKVLQISLDFYSGVLMAIDSAKVLGLSTNVQFFDAKQSVTEVNNIINTHNFNDVDAVIGPFVQSAAEAAAGKLESKHIPVISPLTKKQTTNLDNFVQTRPPDEMLVQAMLSYLTENAAGKNIVIIADSDALVKSKLTNLFPSARTVNPRQGSYINQSEVASAMSRERPNWVILETNNIGILSNATSYLNSIADTFDITLFTTDKNESFESDNVSNSHLSRLKLHFPSIDKEFDATGTASFIARYHEKYGVVPNTYAIRGFDVTFDTLLRMASAESLMESMEAEGTTEYVENKFDYEKRNTGGYLNKAIYIMAYGDGLKLNVVK